MSSTVRMLAYAVIVLSTMVVAGCDEQGIGIGVPAPGARWGGGGGGSGPAVLVGGGPVYR
jgi:hypothetical protein